MNHDFTSILHSHTLSSALIFCTSQGNNSFIHFYSWNDAFIL